MSVKCILFIHYDTRGPYPYTCRYLLGSIPAVGDEVCVPVWGQLLPVRRVERCPSGVYQVHFIDDRPYDFMPPNRQWGRPAMPTPLLYLVV